MPQYCYSPLSEKLNIIRLLRLLPSRDEPENLRCELFEYTIQVSDGNHPYEALSYVWGGEDKPQSIIIGDQELAITQNLHMALLGLRDREISRIIWVDAVCINQEDEKEKGHQIQFMAAIYAIASCVIVWLGEAQDDGERALELIRIAGKNSATPSDTEPFDDAILQVLKRPWFRRIWVLQEVAAARHVIIKCGSVEIEGHAFCLGLEFLKTTLEDSMCLVTSLIRGAIFRSRRILETQKRLSLDICSLGELVDTYHSHGANVLHDKVYALLGMSSDDLSVARLKPDYNVPWKVLMQSLVEFLIGAQDSVDTWNDREIAVIRTKGCILGKVYPRKSNSDSHGRQNVVAEFKSTSQQLGCIRDGIARWTLQASAKSIQKGDLLCVLHGASKPSIIRLRKDHFAIIVIAADPPEYIQTTSRYVKWMELSQLVSFTRNFLLIWDWEINSENLQDPGK
ncbi:heterokaryon incompatibility protein-domain-containing protein, partial [Phaeosphaeriaceae sp. PMI808]